MNTQNINWTELFLSSTGRSGQVPSVIAGVVLLLVLAFYEAVVSGPVQLLTGLVVYTALFFSAACVLSKRLHDRGRSGWWAMVILIAFVMVRPYPIGVFDFLAVCVLIWAFIELAIMPGERGFNRYGPPEIALKE